MTRLSSAACFAALAAALAAAACAQKSPAPTASSTPSQTAPQPQTASPSSGASATPRASEVASLEILDEIALTRAAIQARRQAIVTAAMDLTPQESEAFWPLYRDYRNDMATVDDRLTDLILVYAANYDSLSEEMAKTLLTNYLDVERRRVEVKSRHVPRFAQVLPARKVTRFFQVDNKLDKRIQAELAAEIPLTR